MLLSAGERGDIIEGDSIRYAFVVYIEEIVLELEPEDADQLIEYLESLREFPVDLNAASRTDLETLPFLHEQDINRILSLREKLGRYDRETDLFSITGIERERIYLLLNFVHVDGQVRMKRRILPEITIRSHATSEMHRRRGYREGHYLGSPVTMFHRIHAGFSPSIYGGFIAAKAAGENSALEHSSGFLSFGLFDNKVKITAGDYRLQLGQGLLLSSGFGIAKSGNPARGILHRPAGIRPAASRSGHYRFRGGAASIQLSATEVLFFFGATPRTATVLDDGSVRTLITYPVYRTESDREKKNALSESLFGTHIRQHILGRFTLGLTWYSLRYDREFKPDVPGRFSGMKNDHAGIDWSINIRNIHLFGELASHIPVSDPAVLSGIILSLSRGFDASVLYRSYPSGYVSMYGFPFSERRGPAHDEEGIYIGLRYRPAPRHLIEGYFDLYSFSNYFRSPGLPVSGADILLRIEIPVGDVSGIDARVRRRSRPVQMVAEINTIDERIYAERVQNNLRLNFVSTPHHSFRLRIQHERVFVSYPGNEINESGSYIAADIRWSIFRNLRLNARYILFGTESFDSRLYTSEYDMPGRVRTVLLNGEGSVFSFGLQYDLLDSIRINIKYGETFRSDGVFIGSGFQEVDGPALGILMFQIDARL